MNHRQERWIRERLAHVYDHQGHLLVGTYTVLGVAVSQRVTYVYDAFGNRIERSAWNGSTTVERFAVDGWDNAKQGAVGTENFDVWADLSGSNTLSARRVMGGEFDQVLAKVAGSVVTWYGVDRQGSVRQVLDNSGSVIASSEFDGYGNLIAGSLVDRYGYTGREWDSALGLYYSRARMYSPTIGRFLSEDPIAFAAGDANLYRYVRNGPTNGADPSGMFDDESGIDAKELAANQKVVAWHDRGTEILISFADGSTRRYSKTALEKADPDNAQDYVLYIIKLQLKGTNKLKNHNEPAKEFPRLAPHILPDKPEKSQGNPFRDYEATLAKHTAWMKAQKWSLPVSLVQHYLGKTGTPYKATAKEIAEVKSHGRNMVIAVILRYYEKEMAGVKSKGDTIQLDIGAEGNGKKVRFVNPLSPPEQVVESMTSDGIVQEMQNDFMFYTYGGAKIKIKGTATYLQSPCEGQLDYKDRRIGKLLTVKVQVEFWDDYEFHERGPFGMRVHLYPTYAAAHYLGEKGGAKAFDFRIKYEDEFTLNLSNARPSDILFDTEKKDTTYIYKNKPPR